MNEKDLEDKFISISKQINELVANARGYGPLASLSPAQHDHLRRDVEELIDSFEEAISKGNTIGQWRVRQLTVPSVELGKLLARRHEIADFIVGGQNNLEIKDDL